MPLPSADTPTLEVYVKITITTQWALSSLYTVKAATLPWRDVQDRVARLKSELETLLPQIADRQRLMLHFAWFDAMILITRPSLCAPGHTDRVTQDTARQCVKAAQGVARLLTDEPDERIFWNGPWWCLAHYIVRAMGVFKMAIEAQTSIEEEVRPAVDKLVRWLRWMARDDYIAAQGIRTFEGTSLIRGGSSSNNNNPGFAGGAFEQGDLGTGAYSFVQNRWDGIPAQPQFLDDFHALDDLLDSDGVISTMVSQARPDMLPMPPVYGTPYG